MGTLTLLLLNRVYLYCSAAWIVICNWRPSPTDQAQSLIIAYTSSKTDYSRLLPSWYSAAEHLNNQTVLLIIVKMSNNNIIYEVYDIKYF